MAADKNFFTVGEISELTGVSRQAIRYYDKIGLLKPGKVDSGNAYRYYEPMHILYLNTIMRLQQLGCSLKEVKKYISGDDIADTRSTLEIRKDLTEKKIAELKSALKTLEKQIGMIEEGISAHDCDTAITKDIPQRYYIYNENAVQPGVKQGILQINRMVKEMEQSGMLFVCSPVFEIRKDRNTFKTGFFYDEMPESAPFPVDLVPEGRYACIYHRGKYDDMPVSVEKLYRYLQKNGMEAQSGIYQLYLIDYALTQSEEELLTELQVRIG